MLRLLIVMDETTDVDLWAYTVLHYRVDEIYVVAPSAKREELRVARRAFSKATYVDDASEIPGNLVLVSPLTARLAPGCESLADFVHPLDACYVFGPDNTHLDAAVLAGRTAPRVYIPTHTDDAMHAHVAAAVVLWDRVVKHG